MLLSSADWGDKDGCDNKKVLSTFAAITGADL